MHRHNAINTMKRQPDALRALGQLLAHRDAMDMHEQAGQSHRSDRRHALDPPRDCVLELAGEAGSSRAFLAYARDVSSRGVSVFHGVFVALGTC
jgi:hypothetical protein